MKSWSKTKNEFVKTPEKVLSFIADIEKIYKKHNLSISHEDKHGSFIIEQNNSTNVNWLKNSAIAIKIDKLVECPNCLGITEVFIRKGRASAIKKCNCCNGKGKVKSEIADAYIHEHLLQNNEYLETI